MSRKILWVLLLYFSLSYIPAFSLTKLFYAMRSSDAPRLIDHFKMMLDVKKHHDQIDILVPQSYVITSRGQVFDRVEPNTQKLTKQFNIKLMPLVTNENFDAEKVDHFLQDKMAQEKAIKTLLDLCQRYHYYGLQIDFEHIPSHDKHHFTAFYKKVADTLHKAGYKISIAIIPNDENIPSSSLLLKRYLYWSGAYDQKQLGAASDFLVLMTYNQHGTLSTPGPNASVAWDEAMIKYTLKRVPKNKVYLGIPTSSNYWTLSPLGKTLKCTVADKYVDPNIAHAIPLSYQQVSLLKKIHHLTWQWDKRAKVHYTIFPYQEFYHYVFVEDAASFKAKLELAKQYQLGGIAVFRLGNEDPTIWGQPSIIHN